MRGPPHSASEMGVGVGLGWGGPGCAGRRVRGGTSALKLACFLVRLEHGAAVSCGLWDPLMGLVAPPGSQSSGSSGLKALNVSRVQDQNVLPAPRVGFTVCICVYE